MGVYTAINTVDFLVAGCRCVFEKGNEYTLIPAVSGIRIFLNERSDLEPFPLAAPYEILDTALILTAFGELAQKELEVKRNQDIDERRPTPFVIETFIHDTIEKEVVREVPVPVEKVVTQTVTVEKQVLPTREMLLEVFEKAVSDTVAKKVAVQTIVKEVPVTVQTVQEIIKEVPIEREVIKEVVKEVPIEREVIKEVVKEVPIERETIREVKVEVPVIQYKTVECPTLIKCRRISANEDLSNFSARERISARDMVPLLHGDYTVVYNSSTGQVAADGSSDLLLFYTESEF